VATWAFVADMASASPTVLLDLNTAGIRVGTEWSLDPPSYEKGRAGGSLRHGQRITRSVAGNRTLTIPIEITQANNDAAATVIENLCRQLAVDNILKVQLGTNPVFFRTFADPDFASKVRGILTLNTSIVLQIEAEPFAYGPRVEVTGSPFTVSNNPAAATNPCSFDIAGVLGDVPSPLLLVATSTAASGAPSGFSGKWTWLATRRRGTPSGYSNVIQAEAMTMGTNAVVTADAAMSNGSKVRVTPGTITNVVRVNSTFPISGTATVEARGEYRVLARLAKSVAGDTWDVQFAYGTSSVAPVTNDVVRLPAAAAGPYWLDLGKLPVPAWSDPVDLGYSGVPMKALAPWVALYAARTAGSGSLDIDCLYLLPADDSTLIVVWPTETNVYALDGTTESGGAAYSTTAALDEVVTTSAPAKITGGGGFPDLIPGQTNRIHLIRHVDPAGTVDAITDTTTLRGYYWPRWREFTRP
jgi:hypothetical protein